MIKSLYVDQIGFVQVGTSFMGEYVYDLIEYSPNEEMYRCYINKELVTEYNKKYVIQINYE